MTGRERIVSTIGVPAMISGLGGIYIALGTGWAVLEAIDGDPLAEALTKFLLVAVPGAVILYGGYRLPTTDIHQEVYPRIVAWTLGGFTIMLVVLGLVEFLSGSLDRPVLYTLLITGLGAVGGFGVGRNEAQALTQAKQLRAERDLRDGIIETSPIGMIVLNPDGSIRIANKRAADITGLSRAELEELDHFDDPMFQATDADGNPLEGGIFEEILATGEPAYDVERQFTRADGQRRWLALNGAALEDASGEVTAVVIGFKDITEQKEYLERIEKSNERLEQFAYAASHDLQEPLRMVSSYLQLIENRADEELTDETREFLEYAVDGATRMGDMITHLLEYSRITTEGAEMEPIDANAVFEDVLKDLEPRIEETNAKITRDELPRVMADESQLRQVFQNLISNALKYSGDDPPEVDVSVERLEGHWQFSVADNGLGIDSAHHDKVFEVFETAHPRSDGSESGIGLALCERIVERHGGRIWVESEEGEGATFSFTLPAADGRTEDRSSTTEKQPTA